MNKYFSVLVVIVLLFGSINAQQNNLNVGVSAGLGAIQGNSPEVTAYGLTTFFGFTPFFTDYIDFRIGFIYAQKVEQLLPEDRTRRYYPFIKAFYLKGILKQPITEKLYIEESIGVLVMNDRTFSDTNSWNMGGNFSLALGWDLRKNNKGFTLGPIVDYGLTITNTNSSYILISFQTQYYFN